MEVSPGSPFSLMTKDDFASLKQCFHKDYNIDGLTPYIIAFPLEFREHLKFYTKRLTKHYKQCKETIKEAIETAQTDVYTAKDNAAKFVEHQPEQINKGYILRDHIVRYNVLMGRVNELGHYILDTQTDEAESRLDLLNKLIILINWLLKNPQPFMMNMKRIIPKNKTFNQTDDQMLYREHCTLKASYKAQMQFILAHPPAFRIQSENRKFFRNAVDTAMDNLKPNTTYFEPLTIEPTLFAFLLSQQSPLAKEQLLPIQVTNDVNSVKQWILKAVDVLTKFDAIDAEERRDVITVFVSRLIFENKVSLLCPKYQGNLGFAKKMAAHALKNPGQANIPEKFVPENLMDQPMTEYFKTSSIMQAPIEWFRLIIYKYCPLDIAYCIFKVHESLTIMAALTATQQKKRESSEDFFAQMPGFDDIFDLWVAALCVSELPAPQSISEYMTDWSRLPGIPNRFVACCAYLEAAVSHIDSLEEVL